MRQLYSSEGRVIARMHADVVLQIGLAIITASIFAFLAKLTRQPLILAYLAAGVVVGKTEGFGWVDTSVIEPISELGLVLLLFLIGMEIDLKKLSQSGKVVVVSGVSQFVLCVGLGLLFLPLLGFHWGELSTLYLAIAASLSSTLIVVKLLYDKFEIDSIPGRITLGILVFQDIWAILFLALQPNLRDPAPLTLAVSVAKGLGLVAFALLISRYVLPYAFRSIAKFPELVMISALGWCFTVSLLASKLGLSREMGALIAGVSISSFPYNLDVVAKIVSLRDFFVVLFFVTLGSKIPRPTPDLIGTVLAFSGFLVVSRFLSIFPILHTLRTGNRVSFIASLNLSQISEFSLVICALGVSFGHIPPHVMSVVVLTLAITSVTSTYAIMYSHSIFTFVNPWLIKLGIKDVGDKTAAPPAIGFKSIILLGFSRYASSLMQELISTRPELADELFVIDFNPEVKQELDRRGISNSYGDVGHLDTLKHAKVQDARLLISTIPDVILKGTSNERLLKQLRTLAPQSRIFVTADFFYKAIELYGEGADFVFVPRLMNTRELADAVIAALQGSLEIHREDSMAKVQIHQSAEVLP
jgi:Kef-type K+ transport system membrane component KefB/voltage-gated potassium channel Kch